MATSKLVFLKINCDGAVDSSGKKAGFGFVVRDSNAFCIAAVSKSIPVSYVETTEAIAIREAVLFAIFNNWSHVDIESDSSLVIESLFDVIRSLWQSRR